MKAMASIDISMAGWPEHAGVARRPAAEAMRGRVVFVIGFGLDDRAADAIDQKRGSDQRTRDRLDVPREELRR